LEPLALVEACLHPEVGGARQNPHPSSKFERGLVPARVRSERTSLSNCANACLVARASRRRVVDLATEQCLRRPLALALRRPAIALVLREGGCERNCQLVSASYRRIIVTLNVSRAPLKLRQGCDPGRSNATFGRSGIVRDDSASLNASPSSGRVFTPQESAQRESRPENRGRRVRPRSRRSSGMLHAPAPRSATRQG
jgi:hypothetical protein